MFRCCALRWCAGGGVAELLIADCLLARIPPWLLFTERPQSQPSTRRLCQAHWWRIWDVWPPSHCYARAVLLGLRRALSAITRCAWIAGVRPQGGHSERGGVRGAEWQFTAGGSSSTRQADALCDAALTRERGGGSGRGVPEAALSFSSLFAMLRCVCLAYRCAV